MRPQLVDEAAVEVEPLGFEAPIPFGSTRGQDTLKRYDFAPSAFMSATSSLKRW